MQCNANAIQYNPKTIQYDTVQCNAIQRKAMQ